MSHQVRIVLLLLFLPLIASSEYSRIEFKGKGIEVIITPDGLIRKYQFLKDRLILLGDCCNVHAFTLKKIDKPAEEYIVSTLAMLMDSVKSLHIRKDIHVYDGYGYSLRLFENEKAVTRMEYYENEGHASNYIQFFKQVIEIINEGAWEYWDALELNPAIVDQSYDSIVIRKSRHIQYGKRKHLRVWSIGPANIDSIRAYLDSCVRFNPLPEKKHVIDIYPELTYSVTFFKDKSRVGFLSYDCRNFRKSNYAWYEPPSSFSKFLRKQMK